MAFNGQWGPDTLIDIAGNTRLIGATATAVGYVCAIDPLGNMTVTGPANETVMVTVRPLAGVMFTVMLPVLPVVADLLTLQTTANGSVQLATDNTYTGGNTFTSVPKPLRSTTSFGVGAGVGNPRGPFCQNNVIDGSTLGGSIPAGTSTDVVGQQNNINFVGGFTSQVGVVGNPGYLFGANDYITTGTTTGDMASITNIFGRLSEIHVATPSASISGSAIATSSEANMETTATGTTVGTLISHRARGPIVKGGTATTAISLRVTAPAVSGGGVIGTAYGIFADGAVYVSSGLLTANAGFTASGNTVFTGIQPNAQASTAGVYAGTLSGNYGVGISDGTNMWGIDTTGGDLRFMKAGVQQNAKISLTGDMTIRGGVGFYNTSPTTKQTVSGSRGANAALASLLTALAAYGLVIDSSTA